MSQSRRHFLTGSILSALAGTLAGAESKKVNILVRSGWETVSLADSAHTAGLLRLLESCLPKSTITLWAVQLEGGVREMLQAAFPKVNIVHGQLDSGGAPQGKELADAWKKADLLLHGSGPGTVARAQMTAWRKNTKKPYGIFGVTIGELDDAMRALLDAAAFIFCRDGVSLSFLKAQKIQCPIMDFTPDAIFGFELRDETRGAAFLKKHNLESGQFICAIPRLRYTPYHEIYNRQPTAEEKENAAVSAKFKEQDHAKLRDAMELFIRRTGRKVVVCPEMTYQVAFGREMLVDPLPEEVRKNVVWRDSYWLPDEAAAIFKESLALVSFEMNAPIMAAAAGVPAIHLRQPTNTSKGQMWRDVGLKNWIFEIDETSGEQIGARLLEIHDNPAAAREQLATAMAGVKRWHAKAMEVVLKSATF